MSRLTLTTVVLLYLALAFASGWSVRGLIAERDLSRMTAQHATALADAHQAARAIEHHLTQQLADIGDTHAHDQQHTSPGLEADIMSALHHGTVRLRDEWRACETRRVSELAATAAERDAATQGRDRLAAAIVRIGHDADQQLAACQAVIRAYLSTQP